MVKTKKTFWHDLWLVIKDTSIHWNASSPWRQSAILAYYAIFSLPALMLITIVIAGSLFGEETVSDELTGQIAEMLGKDAAKTVEAMVANVAETGSSTLAMWTGIGFLLFGATSVFYHLQVSLNKIWGVIPRPRQAFLKYAKDRLLSFGLVLAIGFLLLLSLLVTSLLAILGDWLKTQWPQVTASLLNLSNYAISLTVITVLFALMFKVLPDAIIRWRSVWVGALLTAILFTLGQYGLSVYFSLSNPASAYGAAGAVILILIWTSYVAMILLYGAEFTRQWANRFGHGIRPKNNAILVEDSNDPRAEITE